MTADFLARNTVSANSGTNDNSTRRVTTTSVGPPGVPTTMALYRPLAVYGEHKRAVSSVKFAPSRLCKNRSSSVALVASASADGTCKLWDIQQSYLASFNSNNTDTVLATAPSGGDGGGGGTLNKNSITADPASNPHPQQQLEDNRDGEDEQRKEDGKDPGPDHPEDSDADPDEEDEEEEEEENGIHADNSQYSLDPNDEAPQTTMQQQKKSRRNSNQSQSQKNVTVATAVICQPKRKLKPKKNPFHKPLKALSTCVGHSRGINDVAWNPSCPLLATASDDKTIRLWDAVTSEAIVELRGHDNFVSCVDQLGSVVVSGSFDETVKLWDIRTGDCVCTLPAHSDPVTAVAFNNRDGSTVASASHDGLVRIWDVATGECLKTIYAAGNPPVTSLVYAPNGRYVLAGTLDNALRLWPVTTTAAIVSTTTTAARNTVGANFSTCLPLNPPHPHYHGCVRLYREDEPPNINGGGSTGRRHFVNTKFSIAATWTGDGRNVVTGSETGDVVLFDTQTGRVAQVLEGQHSDAVLAVSAHDSMPLIVSGGMTADRKVKFWSAIAAEPTRTAD